MNEILVKQYITYLVQNQAQIQNILENQNRGTQSMKEEINRVKDVTD